MSQEPSSISMTVEGSVTQVGFEQTIIGMVAFLVGVIIAVFVRPPGRPASAGPTQDFTPRRIKVLDRLALLYLIVGAIVSFALLPLAASIPSATAVVAPLGSLIVVGACVRTLGGERDPKLAQVLVHNGSVACAPPCDVDSRRLSWSRYELGNGYRFVSFRSVQAEACLFFACPCGLLRRAVGIRELHGCTGGIPAARLAASRPA